MSDPTVTIACRECISQGNTNSETYSLYDLADITSEDFHKATCGNPEIAESHPLEDCLFVEASEGFSDDLLTTHHIHSYIALAENYAEVGEEQWDAYCAWGSTGECVVDALGVPDVSAFEDRYRGSGDTLASWVSEKIDHDELVTAELDDLSPAVLGAIDIDALVDTGYFDDDFWVIPATGHGVYVFRNL